MLENKMLENKMLENKKAEPLSLSWDGSAW